MEAGRFCVYLTLTVSHDTATLFARNNPAQGVTVPASVAFSLAIALLLTAAVIVVVRGMHRGRPGLTALLLIGCPLLATTSLCVSAAGWL
jgi:hypothetical protein